jgi:hypothetical protein
MKGILNLLGRFFGVGFKLQTYLNLIYLTLALPLGVFYFALLLTGLTTGLSTAFILVGIVILALTLAMAWWLAEFERQQVIWLVRLPVGPMARQPEAPGVWSWLKSYLGNSVTWTGLLFLGLKFPLGIIAFCLTTTLLALSVGLLAAPLTFWWLPLNIFAWRIDTLPEALLVFAAGLIVLPVSLHLLNFLATGLGQIARGLLGGAADRAQPAPTPAARASGTSCLLPAVAIALFACIACLMCAAIGSLPFLMQRPENRVFTVPTTAPTSTLYRLTATPVPATATASPVVPTATPRPTTTEATPSMTPTPASTATYTSTVTSTLTPMPASATPTETETPTPATTSTPTLTATSAGPDPMAGAGNLLFEETFAPARYYWGTGDNLNSQVQIKEGGLNVTVKTVKRTVWTFSGAPTKTDFYLSGVVTPTVCPEDGYFGLAFRAQDDGNLFLFGVSCDGRYQLMQYVNGTARSLVAPTPSSALRPQAANQLGVRAVGKQIDLYANGQFLASVEAGPSLRGLFGVYASSAAAPGLSVVFGNLQAWEIKP